MRFVFLPSISRYIVLKRCNIKKTLFHWWYEYKHLSFHREIQCKAIWLYDRQRNLSLAHRSIIYGTYSENVWEWNMSDRIENNYWHSYTNFLWVPFKNNYFSCEINEPCDWISKFPFTTRNFEFVSNNLGLVTKFSSTSYFYENQLWRRSWKKTANINSISKYWIPQLLFIYQMHCII